MALTNRQLSFTSEYVLDFNATAAAIRAGYSAATARQIGSENLTKPDIRTEIERCLKVREQESSFTREKFIARLVEEVEADAADLFDEAGYLLPVQKWPLVWRTGLVRSARVEEIRTINGIQYLRRTYLRFGDRLERQNMLGRCLGCFL